MGIPRSSSSEIPKNPITILFYIHIHQFKWNHKPTLSRAPSSWTQHPYIRIKFPVNRPPSSPFPTPKHPNPSKPLNPHHQSQTVSISGQPEQALRCVSTCTVHQPAAKYSTPQYFIHFNQLMQAVFSKSNLHTTTTTLNSNIINHSQCTYSQFPSEYPSPYHDHQNQYTYNPSNLLELVHIHPISSISNHALARPYIHKGKTYIWKLACLVWMYCDKKWIEKIGEEVWESWVGFRRAAVLARVFVLAGSIKMVLPRILHSIVHKNLRVKESFDFCKSFLFSSFKEQICHRSTSHPL